MRIRNKLSIIVLAAWIIIIFTLYLGSQLIIKKSYLALENELAISNLERAEQAIRDTENSVANTLADWAAWDDSYNFMMDKDQKYIQSNLVASGFAQSNIDIILYFKPDGSLYYSVAADETRTKEAPLPEGLFSYIAPGSILVNQSDVGSKTQGLIYLPSGILAVAARPIVTSSNQGPVRGTLVMGRYLTGSNAINDETNQKIINITKVNTSLYPLESVTSNNNLQAILKKLLINPYYVTVKDKTELLAYVLLRDINNKPIAIIEERIPRHVYEIGLQTISYYNLLGLVSSILLILILWLTIHSLVVRRIEKLKDELNNSRSGKQFTLLSRRDIFPDEINSVATIYHHATHDPLTGLGNRFMLNQAFNNSYLNIKMNNKIALLFIDIDNFKFVNDTFGHDVGDKILSHASRVISSNIRGVDIASRLGGDEFVVLLIDMSREEVDRVTGRMFEALRKEAVIDGYHLEIKYSIGISIYPDNGNDIYSLIKFADIALYHAKALGKNQIQYYSDALTIALQEANQRELELQKAIDNNELCLFYQPIVDSFTNKPVSVEALIRWRHPTRGLLPASEIIPIAERSGLIVPIGRWVLRRACEQVQKWIQAGLEPIPVSVNISLLQIKNMSIDKLVTDVITETGIDPTLLELELTETAYIEINNDVIDELKLLRKRGIHLTIDDFGSGYSGIGYLKSLPVSKLKVDYSFVRDILNDADDRAIILAIITIAHQLNLKVVAEGVETLYQYEFLKKNEVDFIQGNYFSPPVDPETCYKILESSIMRQK